MTIGERIKKIRVFRKSKLSIIHLRKFFNSFNKLFALDIIISFISSLFYTFTFSHCYDIFVFSTILC